VSTEIGDAAVKYVMECLEKEYLEKKGKKPVDVSNQKKGYDIKCGRLIIEVKGTAGNRNQNIVFSRQKEYNTWKNNKAKYRLYRVYNVHKFGLNAGGADTYFKVWKGTEINKPKRDKRWRVTLKRKKK
jgi:hypothetical protein